MILRACGRCRASADDVAVVPIDQGDLYDSTGSLTTTPAFVRQYARTLGMRVDELPGNEIARVQLRHGASDLRVFTADVDRVACGHVATFFRVPTRVSPPLPCNGELRSRRLP